MPRGKAETDLKLTAFRECMNSKVIHLLPRLLRRSFPILDDKPLLLTARMYIAIT